jgi:predicted nucleic acid binding AN1-type Zn finger protein
MEFPELGVHCGRALCHRLDFLPAKCDACSLVFCSDHLGYDAHTCTHLHTKNVQVPVCPLCSRPCPVERRGDAPDVVVSRHIDSECQSDPAKERRKVFDKRCEVKKCKKKEMVRIRCDECTKNFCLAHRHPQDHECAGKPTASSSAAAAAMSRLQTGKKTPFKTPASPSPPRSAPATSRGS